MARDTLFVFDFDDTLIVTDIYFNLFNKWLQERYGAEYGITEESIRELSKKLLERYPDSVTRWQKTFAEIFGSKIPKEVLDKFAELWQVREVIVPFSSFSNLLRGFSENGLFFVFTYGPLEKQLDKIEQYFIRNKEHLLARSDVRKYDEVYHVSLLYRLPEKVPVNIYIAFAKEKKIELIARLIKSFIEKLNGKKIVMVGNDFEVDIYKPLHENWQLLIEKEIKIIPIYFHIKNYWRIEESNKALKEYLRRKSDEFMRDPVVVLIDEKKIIEKRE